ncbi:hypothetical protein AYO22_03732 [Fonsecaea multimorphosa]|nr:hypothetical protein AYO22_03732 [Fonsecaea multimorphosa]
MSAEDCRILFQEERLALLDRYRFAVQQALARANFLSSRTIVTLQSLLIYLACDRGSEDSSLVWVMTGTAIRLAQSLGLHRDGTLFNLSPFETEMRRRLWWQLCLLDVRTAENNGSNQDISQRNFDARLPLNIDDSALDPSMTETPVPKSSFTETTLSLIRYEIITVLRRLRSQSYAPGNIKYTPTLQEIDTATERCRKNIKDNYLKYCDPKVPFHSFMEIVSRMMIARMWINVHHLFRLRVVTGTISEDIKERIFSTSLEIVEAWLSLNTENNLRQWRWAFQNYVPWQALAFILSELCTRTRGIVIDRAWIIARKAFDEWTNIITDDPHNMLWLRIKKLLVMAQKAQKARDSILTETSPSSRVAAATTSEYHLRLPNAWDPLDKLQSGPESVSFFRDHQTAQLGVAALTGPSDVSQIMGRQEYQWTPEEAAVIGDIDEGLSGNPFGLVYWDAATDNSDTMVNRPGLFDEPNIWW